jgi:hypothetical protein
LAKQQKQSAAASTPKAPVRQSNRLLVCTDVPEQKKKEKVKKVAAQDDFVYQAPKLGEKKVVNKVNVHQRLAAFLS